jgi:hypothetical protein
MKKNKLVGTVALMCFGFALSAHADCPFPKAPDTIPDGKTATEAEMLAAMNAFKAYDADVVAFRKCIEEEGRKGATMAHKAMQQKKLAAVQEDLETKAKLFNEQVRIFKARS